MNEGALTVIALHRRRSVRRLSLCEHTVTVVDDFRAAVRKDNRPMEASMTFSEMMVGLRKITIEGTELSSSAEGGYG